ncbi:MAG: nucleotidyltransferase domain-containing protein [Gemmatimonadota bacterium]
MSAERQARGGPATAYLKNTADALTMTDAQAEAVEKSLVALRRGLTEYFPDLVKEQITFGSYTRGTNLPLRVDPYSDVDHMVVFARDRGERPQTFLDRLKRFADDRYPRSLANQSRPAVVLILNHIRFDLVPAYKDWWGDYRIPARATAFEEWIDTAPNDFKPYLDRRHRETDFQMKPLIRLLKYWNALNDYPFETYRLEKKIANRWYPFCDTLAEYLASAFDGLSNLDLRSDAREAVRRARKIIDDARRASRSKDSTAVEMEIQRLLPPL